MTPAQITTITFIILWLIEAHQNFKLKKMIREMLEGNDYDRW